MHTDAQTPSRHAHFLTWLTRKGHTALYKNTKYIMYKNCDCAKKKKKKDVVMLKTQSK